MSKSSLGVRTLRPPQSRRRIGGMNLRAFSALLNHEIEQYVLGCIQVSVHDACTALAMINLTSSQFMVNIATF
jgi:hypothetical protein